MRAIKTFMISLAPPYILWTAFGPIGLDRDDVMIAVSPSCRFDALQVGAGAGSDIAMAPMNSPDAFFGSHRFICSSEP